MCGNLWLRGSSRTVACVGVPREGRPRVAACRGPAGDGRMVQGSACAVVPVCAGGVRPAGVGGMANHGDGDFLGMNCPSISAGNHGTADYGIESKRGRWAGGSTYGSGWTVFYR
jgi:hypothetical protein